VGSSGSSSENSEPFPGPWLRAETSPPCISTSP
jgi:hypothetical protein